MKTQLTTLLGISLALLTMASISITKETPPADYSWLEGRWTGDGFGGTSEEVWSAPSEDGTMLGTYRHFKADGSANFYEFLVLDKTGLRLKHFNPDMSGWETKEDYVTFEMIKTSEGLVELKGLIYEKVDENTMKIRLKMKYGEEVKTEVFTMTKES